jgi:hypothetical protein
MPHADELLLAGRDAARDPATDLFLQDHLRECAECRELRRKVERADLLIASPLPPAGVPPRNEVRSRPALGRVGIASVAVAVIIVGVVAGTAIRTFREGDGTSQIAAPGRPVPSLPKDWQLLTLHDLLIPLPPGWQKTIDAPANPPGPDAPRILYFDDRAGDRGPAQSITVWIWPDRSLDQLVRERFVEGNLSLVSQGTVASWRPTREVIGAAQWSDARGSGSYLARNLFVQVDPERIVMVGIFGPPVPSQRTEPTPEMRSIQDIVTRHLVALPDVDRVFTADQALAAIDRQLPLGPGVLVRGRSDSVVHIFVHQDRTTRLRASPRDVSLSTPETSRGIGNLEVAAASPDANVRYTILTALDALLEPAPATRVSPVAASAPGSQSGTCTTGPLTESARNGEYVFRTTLIDAGNEFVLVQKRGAQIGERMSAILRRLDAPGQVGLPPFAAEPLGPGELIFKVGIYKPAGKGCWQVDLMDPSDGRVVARYVVDVRDPANGCPRTRSTDASGVITSSGLIGVIGDTSASSADINGKFVMIRRASKPGDHVELLFQQVGANASAPASSVSYGVSVASGQTPWGDGSFDAYIKPIGFPNSCWKVLVDGIDSGIVLFVGP